MGCPPLKPGESLRFLEVRDGVLRVDPSTGNYCPKAYSEHDMPALKGYVPADGTYIKDPLSFSGEQRMEKIILGPEALAIFESIKLKALDPPAPKEEKEKFEYRSESNDGLKTTEIYGWGLKEKDDPEAERRVDMLVERFPPENFHGEIPMPEVYENDYWNLPEYVRCRWHERSGEIRLVRSWWSSRSI
jgi:hypothetical protein